MPESVGTVVRDREQHPIPEMSSVTAERRRIARDIHDRIGQQIACLKLHLHSLERDGDRDEIQSQLVFALDRVDEISSSIHDIVFGLRDQSADRPDLRSLVRDTLQAWGQQNRIDVDFRADGDFSGINPALALSVLGFVCEATTNITKHARGATTARISLTSRLDHLRLTIVDDGAGFASDEMLRRSEAQSMSSRQFGIRGMRERVEEFGGELSIVSAASKGTSLSAFIPLTARRS